MSQQVKEHWTPDDLPNVIESLKQIIGNDKKNDDVRQLATDIAVFLICLQKDLEHNNII